MPLVKRKTITENFFVASKHFVNDKELSLVERGLLATIYSLGENWDYSVKGMSMILPDGTGTISNATKKLKEKGYIKSVQVRNNKGKYANNELHVFDKPCLENPSTENPSTENLSTENPQTGEASTDYPPQYNNNILNTQKGDNKLLNIQEFNKRKSIIHSHETYQSNHVPFSNTDITELEEQIEVNIGLKVLRERAIECGPEELNVVNEIYSIICDLVCFEREFITINKTAYPWERIRNMFLDLRYEHVVNVIEVIMNKEVQINSVRSYVIAMLYNELMGCNIREQAGNENNYIGTFRGKPYER